MKSIDIKSLIIGALLTSTIFLGVAATSPKDNGGRPGNLLTTPHSQWDNKQVWEVREFSRSQIRRKINIGYELTEDSRVASFVGMGISMDAEPAKEIGGILVVEVLSGKPAEAAGLRANDIISAIDGKKFLDSGKLIDYIQKDKAKGDVVTVKIKRANLEMEFKVTLGFSHNEMVYSGRKRVQ